LIVAYFFGHPVPTAWQRGLCSVQWRYCTSCSCLLSEFWHW